MRLRLALATYCCIVAPAAAARAEVTASLHPSFRPDARGARTAFTLSFGLGVGEEGVPPPVTHITLRLPASKLAAVNVELERSAWGVFRTECYPAYDFVPVRERIKERVRNGGQ